MTSVSNPQFHVLPIKYTVKRIKNSQSGTVIVFKSMRSGLCFPAFQEEGSNPNNSWDPSAQYKGDSGSHLCYIISWDMNMIKAN